MRTTKEYVFESSKERLEEMIPFILDSIKNSEQLSNEVVEELMNTINRYRLNHIQIPIVNKA